jgi:cytochrome P450
MTVTEPAVGHHLSLQSPKVGAWPGFFTRTFDFLREMRVRHGDVYTLDMGLFRLVALNHPDHFHHVFVANGRNYRRKGLLYETSRALLGNGLGTSEGDFWLRQRRMMQPHFHRQRVAEITDIMVNAIDQCLATWPDLASTTQPFDLYGAFKNITMSVLVHTLFGTNLAVHEAKRLEVALSYAFNYVFPGMMSSKLPAWVPFPGKKRNQQMLRDIDDIIFGFIRAYQTNPDSHSLLGMLLDQVDAETGERMTTAQVRDEVVTLFVAGYDTTSVSMAWVFDFLTRYPNVYARLQAEIEQVLGDRRPSFADITQLPYTRMVVQEVMRLRPATWFATRTAVNDDIIGGYHIPAGTMVFNMFYVAHHHPDIWEEPDRFDPERFTPEHVAQRHKHAWMPFGHGGHQCIGKDFSLIESALILARVLQCYHIERVPGHVAKMGLTTTLQPLNGMPVLVQRR